MVSSAARPSSRSYTKSNLLNKNAVNEKIFSAEIGYGYHSPILAVTVNAYYTKWYDRTMIKSGLITDGVDGSDAYSLNLQGVDARHMGIEIAAKYKPAKWVEFDAMVSLGDWQWDSNASGYFYNQNGAPLKNLNGAIASGIMAEDHLYATLQQKGVKVSGSAQNTAALGATFKPFKGFRLGLDWEVFANLYSDIKLEGDNLLNGKVLKSGTPWRIPWGNQLDLNASYRFNLGGLSATLYGNVHNLLDYNYVTQAETPLGAEGTWRNAYSVFYSLGRTYSLKLKINF